MLGGMANSADPDQTAPKEQSDLCPHCLFKHKHLGSLWYIFDEQLN